MKPYTYLSILFFTIIICLIASFHPKIRFDKQFKAFLKAAIFAGIPFIIWDIWFTHKGVWWFNTDYTIGFTIFGLPVEEWLFFICIPFSCVFTYYCINKFFNLSNFKNFNNIVVFLTVVVCGYFALRHSDKIYTLTTALFTISITLYLHFVKKSEWISAASFVFLILMLGFFPVNGLLTGYGLESPIVNYNPNDFMQIRILTIPIEDAVYGYAQFLLGIFMFKKFQKKYYEKITLQ